MKKTVNGYMTVEISILFPIIFITICTLFYMCFYFHDRVVSQTFLYRFGIYAYYQNIPEEECEIQLGKGLNERMITSDLVSVKFSKTDCGIEAGADLKMNFIGGLYGKKKFEAQVSIENMDKSGNLRKYRILKEVTE
ncbi:MAG: hypothetical protein HDT39_08590 [Lachnospiraceae bacterium]|nr:hypothetical protein [Lachnospiraceae bacterium]